MQRINLSCRVYKINKQSLAQIKNILKEKKDKIEYDIYGKETKNQKKLYFNVKNTVNNEYGTRVEIYLDKIIFIPTRDGDKPILQTLTYSIQLLEDVEEFNNHLIIYGAKPIDQSIKKAFRNHLNDVSNEDIENPLILVKVDFDKIIDIASEFQNIQYFYAKDINDDRLQDVMIKGDMLEKTSEYNEFVLGPDKGDLNFLGITIDSKLLYIGRDGSIYSRNSFSKSNVTNIVYTLLVRLLNRNAISKTLDEDY